MLRAERLVNSLGPEDGGAELQAYRPKGFLLNLPVGGTNEFDLKGKGMYMEGRMTQGPSCLLIGGRVSVRGHCEPRVALQRVGECAVVWTRCVKDKGYHWTRYFRVVIKVYAA